MASAPNESVALETVPVPAALYWLPFWSEPPTRSSPPRFRLPPVIVRLPLPVRYPTYETLLPKMVDPEVMFREPALTDNPPPSELFAFNTSVPLPTLAKPPLPASGVEMVVVFWFTAMVAGFDAPPSSVSVLASDKVQFCEPDKSPNFNPPMVRAASRVIVRSAARSSVLKSARTPGPFAIMPPFQFVPALQMPSALLVHAPPV